MLQLFDDLNFHLNELALKWKPKKDSNMTVANLYDCIKLPRKAASLRCCGQSLVFGQNILPSGEIEGSRHLMSAKFCKDRFCPVCAWRRSLKNIENLSQVCAACSVKYSFRFLTLTIRNTTDLQKGLDQLLSGWYVFSKSNVFKRHVFGYHRSLEITYNSAARTWHPHLHVLLAVAKNYGSGKNADYWLKDDILDLWRSAARDDLISQVNINEPYYKDDKGIKHYCGSSGRIGFKAVIEACKYEAKDCIEYSPEVFRELVCACRGRRFYSYGGVMRDVFLSLGLEDIESDYVDLIGVSKKLQPDLAWYCTVYQYSPLGYDLKNSFILTPAERNQLNIKKAG